MLGGRSLPHAVMMMIPEAYRDRDDMPEDLKGFYAYHSCLMEPWDGPASVAFTDGRVVGATLDRNGLRPGRWVETTDGYVVLGSESGLLDIPPEQVAPPRAPAAGQAVPRRPRARPHRRGRGGQARGRHAQALRRVVRAQRGRTSPSSPPSDQVTLSDQPLRARQRAFGYTQEDLRVLLTPMARDGAEPVGSMGNDLAAGGALRPGAAAVLLLQAAVRAGHQPADRPDPRGDRDEPRDEPRHRAQPVRRDARARATSSLLDQPILLNRELETLRHVDHERLRARDDRHHLAGRARAPAGMSAALRADLPRGAARRSPTASTSSSSPTAPSGRRRVADPVAAGGRRRAPPPRARGHAPARGDHPRVRRAARGAPLRDADRLRRERDQPVPDARDARRASCSTARIARAGADGVEPVASAEQAAQNSSRRSAKAS